MTGDKMYSEYITEPCLDAIRTMDGPGYGLKQKDLDRIRELKTKYNLDIPSSITNGNVKNMSEELKRDAAGYLAICNTFDMDAAYGDDGDYFFRAMEPYDRSALLTLIHHTGVKPWIDEYNNPASKQYSLLETAKTGIREDMVKSLITKDDGSLVDWPLQDKEADKMISRLRAIKLMYDIGNDSFANDKALEQTYNRWAKSENLIEDIAGCIKAIADGSLTNADAFDQETEEDWEAGPEEIGEPMANVAENNTNEKTGLLSKLTNKAKNLFTNSEESNNAAQGNSNVNMQ
jgi:hypothetical protein